MERCPELNLPAVRLRAARRDGCDYVWDPLRGKWLLLTPEEWVRRHVVAWLVGCMGVEPVRIVQEYPVPLGGMAQRADIVVCDREGGHIMLVECKAADITIDGSVLDQAVRYNSWVNARYVMLTNGIRHYFYVTWNGRDYVPMNGLPDLSEPVSPWSPSEGAVESDQE